MLIDGLISNWVIFSDFPPSKSLEDTSLLPLGTTDIHNSTVDRRKISVNITCMANGWLFQGNQLCSQDPADSELYRLCSGWNSEQIPYSKCLGFLTARGWLVWYALTSHFIPKVVNFEWACFFVCFFVLNKEINFLEQFEIYRLIVKIVQRVSRYPAPRVPYY